MPEDVLQLDGRPAAHLQAVNTHGQPCIFTARLLEGQMSSIASCMLYPGAVDWKQFPSKISYYFIREKDLFDRFDVDTPSRRVSCRPVEGILAC